MGFFFSLLFILPWADNVVRAIAECEKVKPPPPPLPSPLAPDNERREKKKKVVTYRG